MKCNYLTKIIGGQDGAIFGEYLFRFEHNGVGCAYKVQDILEAKSEKVSPLCSFELDKKELVCPHSNSVSFGKEYYAEGDEFPLLYSNVYNNYEKTDDKRIGVCCVYRIMRTEAGVERFTSKLVQIIEIGFVENATLWKMSEEAHSRRPFGNFIVDRETGLLWAFVMRECTEKTRYFSFNTPNVHEGELDEAYGAKKVVLNKEDIIEYFDTEHHRYMQGACVRDGKMYSLEGFNLTYDVNRPPALRIIDLKEKKQVFYAMLGDYGYEKEPEVIEFYGDVCLCIDAYGYSYTIDFE